MSLQTFTPQVLNATDAQFRAWGLQISNALAAIGLVKTSDTGQINWATVTTPANFTAAGYEIWRFDDSLQATDPIFFKLEYGVGSSGSIPYLKLTVGFSTDGAGTINSTYKTSAIDLQATGAIAGTSLTYIAGSTNRVAAGFHVPASSTSTAHIMFAIERIRDENGDTGQGAVVLRIVGTGTGELTIQPDDATGITENGLPIVGQASGANASVGADVGVFPISPVRGWARDPMVGAIGHASGDFAIRDSLNAEIRGVTRAYKSIGHPGTAKALRNGTSVCIAMVAE